MAPADGGALSDTRPDRRQFADEAADRAAVEPRPGRQLRTGERPAEMQVADEGSQVVTPQVLVHGRVGARRVTVRLFCERAWQADPNTTGVCLGARRERTYHAARCGS